MGDDVGRRYVGETAQLSVLENLSTHMGLATAFREYKFRNSSLQYLIDYVLFPI